MKTPDLIRVCRFGRRFLWCKSTPWITLAIAPFNLMISSGRQRTYEQIRYLKAISKIDFAGFYELLNSCLY
ncbi:hypothetical protein [Nodularia chucula]|uniref:hypothetical protein n=1 Tax=Nodularia chucula TaxID=3093667 RepID=UPI0039C62DE0